MWLESTFLTYLKHHHSLRPEFLSKNNVIKELKGLGSSLVLPLDAALYTSTEKAGTQMITFLSHAFPGLFFLFCLHDFET